MTHFKIKMKERGVDGNVRMLETEYIGDVTPEYVIDFFGLNNTDILDYEIIVTAF